MNKCPGCGVIIQFDNPFKAGYLKKEVFEKRKDTFLCERCYKLKHYNYIDKNINVSELSEVISLLSTIELQNSLLCYIVDVFDLAGSKLGNLNKLFNTNNIFIIGNKYDLFYRSNRPTKIKDYIKSYYQDTTFIDVNITSSVELRSIDKLYQKLLSYQTSFKSIIFVGVCNVGKTSLIRALISKMVGVESNLVASNAVGTTLGLNEIKINELTIIDTPGIINKNQFSYYLDKKTLDFIMPTKLVKPTVFQLNPNQTLFISGFLSFSYKGSEKLNVVCYFSNRLSIVRMKYENKERYKLNNLSKLRPSIKERDVLGELTTLNYQIENKEIAFSGLGFISIFGSGEIEIETFKKITIDIRDKLI